MSNINFEHVGRSVRRSVTRLLSVRHTFVFLSKICIWLARRASHMLAYDTYGWPEGQAIIARNSYLGATHISAEGRACFYNKRITNIEQYLYVSLSYIRKT